MASDQDSAELPPGWDQPAWQACRGGPRRAAKALGERRRVDSCRAWGAVLLALLGLLGLLGRWVLRLPRAVRSVVRRARYGSPDGGHQFLDTRPERPKTVVLAESLGCVSGCGALCGCPAAFFPPTPPPPVDPFLLLRLLPIAECASAVW